MRLITDFICKNCTEEVIRKYALKYNKKLSLSEINDITTTLLKKYDDNFFKRKKYVELKQNEEKSTEELQRLYKFENAMNLFIYFNEMIGLTKEDIDDIIDRFIELREDDIISLALSKENLEDSQKIKLYYYFCNKGNFEKLHSYYSYNDLNEWEENKLFNSLENSGNVNDLIMFVNSAKEESHINKISEISQSRNFSFHERIKLLLSVQNMPEEFKNSVIEEVISNGYTDMIKKVAANYKDLTEEQEYNLTLSYIENSNTVKELIDYIKDVNISKDSFKNIILKVRTLDLFDIYTFALLYKDRFDEEDILLYRSTLLEKYEKSSKDEDLPDIKLDKNFILYARFVDNELIPIVYKSYENLYNSIDLCNQFYEFEKTRLKRGMLTTDEDIMIEDDEKKLKNHISLM